MFHERTKDIDVRYHFIRDMKSKRLEKVEKVAIGDNPFDMMTKLSYAWKFMHYLKLLKIGVT